MTYAPSLLLEWRVYVRQHTGPADVSLGIVGGQAQHDAGT